MRVHIDEAMSELREYLKGLHTTKVHEVYGYRIEMELFEEDGDERSDCSVTRTVRGIEFGGSMGMLMGFGTLEDYESGEEYDVPERHRDAIIKWAEANGY